MDDVSERFAEAGDSIGVNFAGAKDSVASTVEESEAVVGSDEEGGSTANNRVHGVIGTMQRTMPSEISEVKEHVIDTVTSQAAPLVESAKSQRRVVTSFARENVLFIGVGAFAAGLAAGLLIPRTPIEEKKGAPIASKATHVAMEAGGEALDRGKEIAKEALEGAASSAQQGGAAGQGDQARQQSPSGRVYTKGHGTMNWDIVEGKWKELKGSARAKWGDLTDDELEEIAGNKDKLVGKLQQKYGYSKDRADREVDDWVSEWDKVAGRL